MLACPPKEVDMHLLWVESGQQCAGAEGLGSCQSATYSGRPLLTSAALYSGPILSIIHQISNHRNKHNTTPRIANLRLVGAACMLAAACLLARVPRLSLPRTAVATRAMTGPGSYTYQWPRPALTVDTVIVAQPQQASSTPAQLLLIQRKHAPCQGQWALPGGFVDEKEPLHAAAARELQEETSVSPDRVKLTQVGAYGDPGRDPRGWTVTVAYAAVVPDTQLGVQAADDAAAASWFDVGQLPALAFDHKLIIREAFEKLAAQATGALQEQLAAGAKQLEGPWTPPTE